jgi:hypothetical protein
MKILKIKIFLLTEIFIFCFFSQSSYPQISIIQFASGFSPITDVKCAGDDRLFVVEALGKIKIVDKLGNIKPTPFLNIQSKVLPGGEQGLLGLAFSPNYKSDGRFYVNYIDLSGNTHISRFRVSSINPDSADASSEELLIYVSQPYANHNGGCLQFGKEGYLYCSLGDGGSGGDPGDRAQNVKDTLGKILRIDVSSANGYLIPPDNPFVNDTSAMDLIWAYGLRNPWRFSFDRIKHDMWIGDVGQNLWEEIDFQPFESKGGENYGWRCYETIYPYNSAGCVGQNHYFMPAYFYSHQPVNGCCVTGGYVYRGGKYASMFGKYYFADYCTGRIQTLKKDTSSSWLYHLDGDFGDYDFGTFGEDRYGELYLGGFTSGILYKIKDADCTPTAYIYDKDTMYICGDSVVLSSPLNDSLEYQWYFNGRLVSGANSNELVIRQNGWYRIRVTTTAGLCSNTSTDVYVDLISPQTLQITGLPTFICKTHYAADLTGYPSGGLFTGEGVTENSFYPNSVHSGTYAVTYNYLTSYGCTLHKEQSITVADCINDSPVIIAPNPTANNITVDFSFNENETSEVGIYDAAGKLCLKEELFIVNGTIQHTFNLPNLSSGVYTFQLKNSKVFINEKFVISKAK